MPPVNRRGSLKDIIISIKDRHPVIRHGICIRDPAGLGDSFLSLPILHRIELGCKAGAVTFRNQDPGGISVLVRHSGINLFLVRRFKVHFNLNAVIIGVNRRIPGEVNIAGLRIVFDIADILAVIEADLRRFGFRSILAHCGQQQLGHIFFPIQRLDIIGIVIGSTHITSGPIGELRVQIILFYLAVVRQIPAYVHLFGIIGLFQRKASGFLRGVISAVGNLQFADVHLVVVNGTGTVVKVQADHCDFFAGIIAQGNLLGNPAVGLFVGLRNVEGNYRIGIILKDHSHFHFGSVVRRALVKGNGYLGILFYGQIRLVQTQEVFLIQCAVDHQGRTALIGAYTFIVIHRALIVLFAVIKVYIQLCALCINPPLPGGQDILDVHIAPLFVVGHRTVHKVLHPMAGIKIGIENVAVNNGTLRDIVRHTGPVGICGACYLGIVNGTVYPRLGGILFRAGEPDAFPLESHPLIISVHMGIFRQTTDIFSQAVMYKIRSQGSDAGHRVSVLSEQPLGVIRLFPTIHAAFQPKEHGLERVYPNGIRVFHGTFNFIRIPPVVQENRIRHVSFFLGVDKGTVARGKFVVVPHAAGIYVNRIIPLHVNAYLPAICQEVLIGRHFLHGNAFFLVDEVPVKTIIIAHFLELVRYRECPILVPHQHRAGGLGGAGEEDTSNGQRSVLMGGIGIGGVGQV